MNEQIRISPIRLIGAEGEQLGLVPTIEALAKAREAGLDLVEVAADERPSVAAERRRSDAAEEECAGKIVEIDPLRR